MHTFSPSISSFRKIRTFEIGDRVELKEYHGQFRPTVGYILHRNSAGFVWIWTNPERCSEGKKATVISSPADIARWMPTLKKDEEALKAALESFEEVFLKKQLSHLAYGDELPTELVDYGVIK